MLSREWEYGGNALGRTERDLGWGTRPPLPSLSPVAMTDWKGEHVFGEVSQVLMVLFFFLTAGSSDPVRALAATLQNFASTELECLTSLNTFSKKKEKNKTKQKKAKQVRADHCGVTLTTDNVVFCFHVIVTLTTSWCEIHK